MPDHLKYSLTFKAVDDQPSLGALITEEQNSELNSLKLIPGTDGGALPLKGVQGFISPLTAGLLKYFRGRILATSIRMEYHMVVPRLHHQRQENHWTEEQFLSKLQKGLKLTMGQKRDPYISWLKKKSILPSLQHPKIMV